ncbi:MAG: EthD family reductase [Opitutae bacterium]|nr:EthD family reductase [Opitutae bacterium]
MIRVSVLYPRTEGARFDWAYYLDSHLPLVRRRLGAALKSIAVEQGLAGGAPGSPPAYVALAHLTFDSVEVFQTAFAAHAPEILADIPRYTPIEPTIQLSDVRLAS